MTTPFFGQVSIFSFNFAPKGWALCNGQLLPINQNQALFALLGTQFGGDGTTTFGLPDLRGAAALGAQVSGPTAQNIGRRGGEATHTLSIGETPMHTHFLNADASTPPNSNTTAPAGNVLGQGEGSISGTPPTTFPMYMYTLGNPTGQLAPAAIGAVGGQSHANMMPSLGISYCIALTGIFPSRN